jgi:hypothetical protein
VFVASWATFVLLGHPTNIPSVSERAVASYSKDPDKKASTPAIEMNLAATIGLPAETAAPPVLALCCGGDVAGTDADPIIALGTGPFELFSASAAVESSADLIERSRRRKAE